MADQPATKQSGLGARLIALWQDESGATSLEWAMLLGAIAVPSLLTIRLAFAVLVGHYRMITTLNALPFP